MYMYCFQKGDMPYSYRLVSVVNHIGSSSVAGEFGNILSLPWPFVACLTRDLIKGRWFKTHCW